MKKSTVVGLVAAGAVVLVLTAAAWWWRARGADLAGVSAPGAAKPQIVSLYAVERRDVPVVIESSGSVVALNQVEIRPQISATVRSVAVREGQKVRRGQVLFTFDDRSLLADLAKARAAAAKSRATWADLERQYRRAQELQAQNFVAQGSVDTVRSQLEAQRAAVAADEAAVRAAEVSASYGVLVSPLDGRSGQISIHPGSLVQPSAAALVTVTQMDPIGVAFQVPEAQLAVLLRGAGGQGVQGAVVSIAPPGGENAAQAQAIEGRVNFIDNAVDSASGTIKVKAEVPNGRQQLWPGQFVTVRLTLQTLNHVAVLPQAALVIQGEKRLVYVVDAQGLAQFRPVQVLYDAGATVAVQGVEAGEKVVVEGKQNLRPATPVKEGAPALAAPGAGA